MSARLPNFLVVGAAKCGTTSLDSYLRQHPEVFLPQGVKETHFLCWESVKDTRDRKAISRAVRTREDYEGLFSLAPRLVKAVGEVCVSYLYFHDTAIGNIRTLLGDPRIVIVLRNPVDRAYSAYLHRVRDGYERETFERALELEEQRRVERRWWGYQLTGVGLYDDQVKAYLNAFSRVKVCLYDDLKRDSAAFLRDLFEFLEVDAGFVPDTSRRLNRSGAPTLGPLYRFLAKDNAVRRIARPVLKRLVGRKSIDRLRNAVNRRMLRRPQMSESTRQRLVELFRDDVLRLQSMIDRNLSHWLSDRSD